METKLVPVVTGNYSEMLIIRSMLGSKGIESYLSNVNLLQSDIASGVKLLVKDTDAAKALKMIRSTENKENEAKQDLLKKPFRMNKILCAVDFSEDSLNAAKYAFQLAHHTKADLRLLHVYNNTQIIANPFPDSFSYQIGMGGVLPDVYKDAVKNMKSFLSQLKSFADNHSITDVVLSQKLIEGDAPHQIVKYARSYKSGLLVVGSRGSGKSKSGHAGSISLNTLELSEMPVMIIPKSFTNHHFGQIQIMYITDFDNRDFSSFRKLMSIVSVFNACIHCVHIEHEKNRLSAVMLDELVLHLKKNYGDFQVKCSVINTADAPQSINEYVAKHKIDMISLTEVKRNFLNRLFSKSLIKDMLYKTSIPLLVYKINDNQA